MKIVTAVTFFALMLCFAQASGSDGISVSAGPIISNLAPMDSVYENRFLTPGTSVGLAVDIDAPGILNFRISGEYFWKNSSPLGWDGELNAFMISIMPLVKYEIFKKFSVFAGAGGVFITGKYSGTNDFGEFVEVEGNSAGFTFSVGTEVVLAGPLSGRLEYRRSFADFKTDNAIIDGEESSVYPPVEADLGSSQFCITFPVSLFGGSRSIF
ncbi:MAG: outer membrane beta-barrel protein [Candidatus Aegiribacteria sp.]|nr:outer membrane beta-barrel protein [Candidatus Aegiribacteria sp.]